MYDYPEESEGHHSSAVIGVSLNDDGKGFIMKIEVEMLKDLFENRGVEWTVLDEVTDETTWRWKMGLWE